MNVGDVTFVKFKYFFGEPCSNAGVRPVGVLAERMSGDQKEYLVYDAVGKRCGIAFEMAGTLGDQSYKLVSRAGDNETFDDLFDLAAMKNRWGFQ